LRFLAYSLLVIFSFFIYLFQARDTHPAVDEAAVDLDEAIQDLTTELEETASDTGAVTALVDSIKKARTSVRLSCLF